MEINEVREQSKNAYNQWCVQWREHAKEHSKIEQKSLSDFEAIGVGKSMVCVANGRSLQDEIETLKKNQHKVDILCCDKSLGHLIDNGIRPKFCVVCDANVNYKKFLAPYVDKLGDTILMINVCANPEWSKNGNWKSIYCFVNKDIILTEKEFCALSKCNNVIPAGTNVSNAMLVLLTQSDDAQPRNFFGYDKYLLVGYDYSWRSGEYYAFDSGEGTGKDFYMRHITLIDMAGEYAYTSANLMASVRWISKYVSAYRLPVVQCCKRTIYAGARMGDLKEQMDYTFYTEDAEKVRGKLKIKRSLQDALGQIDATLAGIAKKHHYNFMATT